MGLLVRERASLPVSIKERDWGEKGGSFWYHCDAMGDQQLDCLFLGGVGGGAEGGQLRVSHGGDKRHGGDGAPVEQRSATLSSWI